MRWLPSGLLLALLLTGPCLAGSPAPNLAVGRPSVPSPSAALPDYGGRTEPGVLAGVGANAPNPLAQAGRSVLALVVVLGGIVGVVTLLKRAGYNGSGPLGLALLSSLRSPASASASPRNQEGKASAGPLTLVQSLPLPGGGTAHLLSVDDHTRVLVGASGQNVSVLAVWEWEGAETMPLSSPVPNRLFSEHLTQAGTVLNTLSTRRLTDLLADTQIHTADHTRL